MITAADAARADAVLARGGVILFGADTVYGLACSSEHREALRRMVAIKGRDPDKPNALLAFNRVAAAPVIDHLGPRTRRAIDVLLPGPVTLVLPGGVALRVPQLLAGAAPLAGVRTLVTQSSANPAGDMAPAALAQVDRSVVEAVDLVLDCGPLPGVPSTVVDLSVYESQGHWEVLREGALGDVELAQALSGH